MHPKQVDNVYKFKTLVVLFIHITSSLLVINLIGYSSREWIFIFTFNDHSIIAKGHQPVYLEADIPIADLDSTEHISLPSPTKLSSVSTILDGTNSSEAETVRRPIPVSSKNAYSTLISLHLLILLICNFPLLACQNFKLQTHRDHRYDYFKQTISWPLSASHQARSPTRMFPCKYPLNRDVETSALLADNVVIGWPSQIHRRHYGPVYNASFFVTGVLKLSPRQSYPIRVRHLLRVGQFSEYEDLGRCWIKAQLYKLYILFISRPDWAGFSRITHVPVPYTYAAQRRIQRILRLGPHPLQMLPIYHTDVVHPDEGSDLMLTCRVAGRPTPIISWFVNQTEIKVQLEHDRKRGIIQTSRDLSKLQLGELKPHDSGNYTCMATNLNGHIRKSVEVIVKPTPTLPPSTVPITTTTPFVPVHPCHGYCYHGQCYLVDNKPYCSCITQFHGTRCENQTDALTSKLVEGAASNSMNDARSILDRSQLSGWNSTTTNKVDQHTNPCNSPGSDCDRVRQTQQFLIPILCTVLILILLSILGLWIGFRFCRKKQNIRSWFLIRGRRKTKPKNPKSNANPVVDQSLTNRLDPNPIQSNPLFIANPRNCQSFCTHRQHHSYNHTLDHRQDSSYPSDSLSSNSLIRTRPDTSSTDQPFCTIDNHCFDASLSSRGSVLINPNQTYVLIDHHKHQVGTPSPASLLYACSNQPNNCQHSPATQPQYALAGGVVYELHSPPPPRLNNQPIVEDNVKLDKLSPLLNLVPSHRQSTMQSSISNI